MGRLAEDLKRKSSADLLAIRPACGLEVGADFDISEDKLNCGFKWTVAIATDFSIHSQQPKAAAGVCRLLSA
jgi:hypothetical protein